MCLRFGNFKLLRECLRFFSPHPPPTSGRIGNAGELTAARVACGKLANAECGGAPAPAPGPPVQLAASSFEKYFSYTGDLVVAGSVTVQFADESATSLAILGDLEGIDLSCTGTQDGSGNACGVHVHAGTSCAENALGHYFSGGSDPWVPITYTDPVGGAVEFLYSSIDTGYTATAMEDKVIVVHDSTGARIACGKLARVGSVVAASDDSVNMTWIPLVAVIVIASLGGWTYYYRSRRQSYGVQQDETVEVQDAAPTQDESMQNAA